MPDVSASLDTADLGTVGYVGLGDMGAGIASRLVRLGFDVSVFDLQFDRIQALVEQGATGVKSVGELAGRSDTLIVCVDPESAVLSVVDSLAPHLGPGHTVIVQSSITLNVLFECERIASKHGAQLFDVPVSGSYEDRQSGNLAVLVGATSEAAQHVRPLLEAIGHPLYFENLGAGAVAKLANNAIMSTTRAVVTEIMEFASAYGLSEADLRKAVSTSSGACWVVDNWDYFDQHVMSGYALRGLGEAQADEVIGMAAEKGLHLNMVRATRQYGGDLKRARYRELTERTQ